MYLAKTGSESNCVTNWISLTLQTVKKLHMIDSHSAVCRKLRFKLAEMNLIDFSIYEGEENTVYCRLKADMRHLVCFERHFQEWLKLKRNTQRAPAVGWSEKTFSLVLIS